MLFILLCYALGNRNSLANRYLLYETNDVDISKSTHKVSFAGFQSKSLRMDISENNTLIYQISFDHRMDGRQVLGLRSYEIIICSS